MILAIDPGREKSGWALVDLGGKMIDGGIVSTSEFHDFVQHIPQDEMDAIVLGDGTFSRDLKSLLMSRPELAALLFIVDEKGSTEEARSLYWIVHPPRGWRKIIPRGLMTPPEDYDHITALVIARRWLKVRRKEKFCADGKL